MLEMVCVFKREEIKQRGGVVAECCVLCCFLGFVWLLGGGNVL